MSPAPGVSSAGGQGAPVSAETALLAFLSCCSCLGCWPVLIQVTVLHLVYRGNLPNPVPIFSSLKLLCFCVSFPFLSSVSIAPCGAGHWLGAQLSASCSLGKWLCPPYVSVTWVLMRVEGDDMGLALTARRPCHQTALTKCSCCT